MAAQQIHRIAFFGEASARDGLLSQLVDLGVVLPIDPTEPQDMLRTLGKAELLVTTESAWGLVLVGAALGARMRVVVYCSSTDLLRHPLVHAAGSVEGVVEAVRQILSRLALPEHAIGIGEGG